MRVIAGTYRSRPLRSLRGVEIRPTSDRLRETLFNVLTAGNPAALQGTVWIDLFAGTGAVGIEALSRGAGMVYFVESSLPASRLIRDNLNSLRIDAGFRILEIEVAKGVRRLESDNASAHVVFLDPPYAMEVEYRNTLELLSGSGLLKDGAMVIVEHRKKFEPGDNFGRLLRFRKIAQGDAALSFYRNTDP